MSMSPLRCFFFFQAEDGIRDLTVTGVQTCALPIWRPAVRDANGAVLAPAHIGVTLPEVLDDIKPGERVAFDDGRIAGVVRSVSRERVEVGITHANTAGLTLGADKGINLPESTLRVPPLTPKDLDDLRFIAERADIVGYSFVRTAEDVQTLQNALT